MIGTGLIGNKGEVLNHEDPVIEMDTAVFYIHGGGFIGGSTGAYYPMLRKIAINTDYPVFAVDYRLAPEYKYPVPLSDIWQAYLWIRHYSEKYLRIKFKKIIVVGDSAGGNLALSLTCISIKKKCIKPDGLHIAYPAFCCDRIKFSPSLLLSLDEFYLSTLFIDYCINSYIAEYKMSKDYLCSPYYIPKKMIK
jgi:acetyl esterase/lipase